MAISLAEEIGHHSLLAWIVGQEATMAIYAGKFDQARLLIETMDGVARGAMVADLASNEARAHAGLNDATRAHASIRAALVAADAMPAEADSDRRYYLFGFPRSMAFLRAARSMLMLGSPKEAQEYASQGLALTRWNRASQEGQAELIQAAAFVQLNELDQAKNVAVNAIARNAQNVFLIKTLVEDVVAAMRAKDPQIADELHHALSEYVTRATGRGPEARRSR